MKMKMTRRKGEKKQMGLSGVRQEHCFNERHGTWHEFQYSLVFVYLNFPVVKRQG